MYCNKVAKCHPTQPGRVTDLIEIVMTIVVATSTQCSGLLRRRKSEKLSSRTVAHMATINLTAYVSYS